MLLKRSAILYTKEGARIRKIKRNSKPIVEDIFSTLGRILNPNPETFEIDFFALSNKITEDYKIFHHIK